MKHRRTWLWLGGSLVAIWAGVGVLAWASAAAAPTAEAVVAYLEANPLGDAEPGDRGAIVDGLADRVNRLGFDQRQDTDLQRSVERAFDDMTPDERGRYVDAVLPSGIEQMIDAINAMSREERQRLVDNALGEIRRARSEAQRESMERRLDDGAFQRIVDEGMRGYLSDASAEAKLDLEPVITEMQNLMRELR